MSQQGSSRALYRCRPCSQNTGQVVYRAGHKCPPQAVQPSGVPPDQPWDLSAIFPTQGISGFLSPDSDVFGLTELPFPTPAISGGVDSSAYLPFVPRLQCLISIPDLYSPGGSPISDGVGIFTGQSNLLITDPFQFEAPSIHAVNYDGFTFVGVRIHCCSNL